MPSQAGTPGKLSVHLQRAVGVARVAQGRLNVEQHCFCDLHWPVSESCVYENKSSTQAKTYKGGSYVGEKKKTNAYKRHSFNSASADNLANAA